MALTAFTRLRMIWGGFDFQNGTDHPYSAAQTASGGSSAASGVGVRRVQLVIDRTAQIAGADPAVMHFDILNMTGGSPDDTWTSGDYTNVESSLDTFWTAVAAYVQSNYKLSSYRFYRVGTGVTKPNPAERITTRSSAGTGSGTVCPPQVACSLTFRTAVRKSWGRTYLPLGGIAATNMAAGGQYTTTAVDALTTALNNLVTGLAANDFYLVVVSKPWAASLNVEHVEVDSNLDVVRRRRWKSATYKKILP